MENSKKYSLIIILGVILFVFLGLWSSIFYTVEAGNAAVIFKLTDGVDTENIKGEGLNFKAPWNKRIIYNVQEVKIEEPIDILDKNGLSIGADVTVRYRLDKVKLGFLHKEFGVNYENKLVVPEVRSAVRNIMGKYTAEEIFSTKRSEVKASIKESIASRLKANYIILNEFLIRGIKLPTQIKDAIENKLRQEQEALAYEFRLQKEKSEAERKKIAAEGEAIANEIINKSLTDNLLKMRGIEATQVLSQSKNAKVIVIGSGKDGLPLILGDN